ncbi:MAG: hypothetical protein NVS1B1_02020 [Candidatus Limnocylindrales bacterium]
MGSSPAPPGSSSRWTDRWAERETTDPPLPDAPGTEVILIRTPAGRDAQLTAAALQGLAETRICADIGELAAALQTAGAVVVAAEALDRAGLEQLRDAIASQPPWSDIPFFVFTSTRSTITENRRVLDALAALGGNVTTLERPVHALTMVNAVRAGLRARRRQYATRQLLGDLEAAVRQRDAFLAMLGHELRNPLGAIGNAVAIATRTGGQDGGSGAVGRQLKLIERQVRVLTRLVNDLLDVSRVTSGKVLLQREPVDLIALIERLVSQLQTTAREERLHLSMTADPGPLRVLGDPVRLEQVFTNLIGNALKYTPPRGRIEVSIHRDQENVSVRVADSGVGIALEALPHVFELFAQADTTIDRSRGGMGVGLTLVRSLVQLHGGTATAASGGPGRGSVFTVSLPLTEIADAAAGPEPSAPAGAGKHVLLVEDNPDNRASLRELLEFCGHRVDTASDGREGVERALALQPEIALVDIGLPELDGYDVAARLRHELGPRIRLVALTGYGQPEDVQRALAAGFDAHVTKPVEFDRLLAILAD